MMERLRKILISVAVIAASFLWVAFTALWAIGPFVKFGGIFPMPFPNQTVDVHAGAGMLHVTFNHDLPATAWWYFYDCGTYPTNLRAQHLDTYRSLRLPTSPGQKTSFGRKTWTAALWTGNQPAPEYTRYWFPVVVPATVFGTMTIGVFAYLRFTRIRRANGQSTVHK